MSQVQELIVYRNPMEKAIWDAMQGGEYFAIIVAAVAFVASFAIVAKVMDRFVPWKYTNAWWVGVVGWGIPSIIAIFTFKHFFI